MKHVVATFPSADSHRRPKHRRLRSLAFVPTLITLGNLVCGFAAIHFGLRAMYDFGAGVRPDEVITLHRPAFERMMPSFLSVGAGLVLLGMVLDCFDGLIARVTRSTTNFGGQLDSLADVITFGAAPATLMVAFMTKALAGDPFGIFPSPISGHALGRVTWISAAVYVAFTAVRLARYNVEHAQADFDHRVFRGMPCPGAACVLVALILFQDQQWSDLIRKLTVYATPMIAMALAFLMVSRIPYRRFHRAYLLGRQPFGHFMIVVLIVAVFFSFPAPTLLIVALWYGLSGPVFYAARLIRERRPAAAPTQLNPPKEQRQTG